MHIKDLVINIVYIRKKLTLINHSKYCTNFYRVQYETLLMTISHVFY